MIQKPNAGEANSTDPGERFVHSSRLVMMKAFDDLPKELRVRLANATLPFAPQRFHEVLNGTFPKEKIAYSEVLKILEGYI